MAALTDSLFSTVDASTDAARAVADSVTRGFGSTLSAAENLGKRVAGTLSAVASSAKQMGEDIIGRAVDVTSEIMGRARGIVVSLASGLVSGLVQVRGFLMGALIQVGSFVAGAFGRVVGAAQTLVAPITGAIQALAQSVVGVITGASGRAGGFLSSIVGGVQALFGLVTGSLSSAFGVVRGVVSGVVGAVSGVVNSVVQGISSLIQSGATLGPIGLGIVAAIAGVVGNFALAFLSKTLSLAAGAMGFVGRALTALPALLAPLWSGLVSVLGTVWTAVRGGLSAVADIARSAFSTLASWAKTVWQWASSLATRAYGFIVANAPAVVSALGSLASTALSLGVGFAKILGIGTLFAAFGAAVWAAAKAAMEFAQNAKTLGAMTGFGTGKSAGILNNFSAQGVGNGAVTSAFGNQSPFAFGLKARAFGLPNFDAADFGEQLASKFQGLNARGPMGNILARSMMRTLGLDSPDFLRLASTGVGTQRANAGFANRINSNLGLDSGALGKYAEAVPSLVTRIGVAFNGVLMKLANESLPMIESVLDGATKIIGQNAGSIGRLISTAVEWMFVRAPLIMLDGVTTVLQITSGALQTLVKWGTWVVTTLPSVLAIGTQAIGDTLRAWAQSFAVWAPTMINGFADFLAGMGETIASWIETIGGFVVSAMRNLAQFLYSVWSDENNPFRVMALQIATGLDSIINGTTNFVGTMAAAGAALGNILQTSVLGIIAAKALGIPLGYTSPSQARADATAGIGTSRLEEMANRFLASPKLPRAADWLNKQADGADSFIANAASNVRSGFGDASKMARETGTSVANSITAGLTGMANALASADGQHNIGRDLGNLFAQNAAPAVDFLKNTLAPGVQNLSEAAQAYKQSLGSEEDRRGRWDEMIAAQKETTSAIRETAQQGGGLGLGIDAMSGYMLKSFAQEQGRAVNAYGGGGTG